MDGRMTNNTTNAENIEGAERLTNWKNATRTCKTLLDECSTYVEINQLKGTPKNWTPPRLPWENDDLQSTKTKTSPTIPQIHLLSPQKPNTFLVQRPNSSTYTLHERRVQPERQHSPPSSRLQAVLYRSIWTIIHKNYHWRQTTKNHPPSLWIHQRHEGLPQARRAMKCTLQPIYDRHRVAQHPSKEVNELIHYL